MAWYTRLTNIARSNRLSRDIDRELEFHLAERAEALVAGGMSPEAAAHEARRLFGNRGAQLERTRDADLLGWLDSILADVRYAWRGLVTSPGFALVAILSVGLGIGANTAIFSLVDAVMLKSLPVSHPEELVEIAKSKGGSDQYTNPIWERFRDTQQSFAGAFAWSTNRFNLANGGESRFVLGSYVSGDYFTTLGVAPAAGRLIARADDLRGCPGVAVVSAEFRNREFGREVNVVGKAVSLDGHPFEIIGVTDPAFFGPEVGYSPELFAPLCTEAIVKGKRSALDDGTNWWISIMGRPKPGLSAAQLAAQLAALAPGVYEAALPRDWPPKMRAEHLKGSLRALPAAGGLSNLRVVYRQALLTLMVVVGLVLLIACGNVANLLLARASVRQREMAVRLAIGAGRGRLVRQLLTESILLALLGAALGVLFARWGSGLIVALLATPSNNVALSLGVDWRVLAFTTGVATMTGLLFGLAPAWRATRVDPQVAMKANGRGVVEGHSRFSIRTGLVVAQVALSLVLVVAAGLLLRSFRKLDTLDPGFSRKGVLLVSADMRKAGFSDERLLTAGRELLDVLRAIPGVRSASESMITPISGSSWNGKIAVDGFVPKSVRDDMIYFNMVSDAYFATLGTPMLAGRDFGPQDSKGSPPVAVINETMARKFFGNANPIGKRYQTADDREREPAVEIIGVVRDAKYRSLREAILPTAYRPFTQNSRAGTSTNFELRTDGNPLALTPAVTAAAARVSRSFALDVRSLDSQVAASLTRSRLLATLSGFFGALALLLAMIGLYGTMAYSVARRRNEIGIRIALGAARASVVRMVLGEAGRMVAAGIVVGTLVAIATTKLVATFLFGLTATDPPTLGASALILAVVALAAGAFPAWRAAKLDPMAALREE